MKLIRDSAIYISGELLSRSIPFILLPYLTRRLGVDGFGQMSYYQTILALFAIIIGLSQDGAVTALLLLILCFTLFTAIEKLPGRNVKTD